MDYFYVFTGMFVIGVAWFRMELLIWKESFRIILGISIALFCTGLILHFTQAERASPYGALLTPLLSLGLFRLCRKFFISRFKHEPRDTYLNWEKGFGADQIFNVVYFVSAHLLLMLTIIGMMELAKAGW